MTSHTIQLSQAPSADELAALQLQLDGATPAEKAQNHHFRPAAIVPTRAEVVLRGGQIVSCTSQSKAFGADTATVQQYEPGFINVPGMGKTPISAAKAAGLLPPHWKEGESISPFDAAPEVNAKSTPAGNPNNAETDKAPTASEAQAHHVAKIAGEILHGVDQVHGPGVADAMLADVADSGDLDAILDRLPTGVTESHVRQVHSGFVAQANSALGKVGSSVAMLEELMDADELRTARRATLLSNSEDLQRLGTIAMERLAQLPNTDPEGFRDMVEAMPAAERKCIKHDPTSGEWRVSIPGHPEMSYGAAVINRLIRV